MRSSFTPEEVDRIENKAYEVGISVGERQERERILQAVFDVRDDYVHDPAYGFDLLIQYLSGGK